MDNAMRDTFARQGYIVVPDVLNQQQLDELNQVYDQHIHEREETLSKDGTDKQKHKSIRGRDTRQTTDRHGNTYVGRRLWSKAYRDLIDNETMLPILEELLGDPSWGPCPSTYAGRSSPLVPAGSRQYTLQAWPETDRRRGHRRDTPRRPGCFSYHMCV